jgi:hypothetical protein
MFSTLALVLMYNIVGAAVSVGGLVSTSSSRRKASSYTTQWSDKRQRESDEKWARDRAEREVARRQKAVEDSLPKYIKENEAWAKRELAIMPFDRRAIIKTQAKQVEGLPLIDTPGLSVTILDKEYSYQQWYALMAYEGKFKLEGAPKKPRPVEPEEFYDEPRVE